MYIIFEAIIADLVRLLNISKNQRKHHICLDSIKQPLIKFITQEIMKHQQNVSASQEPYFSKIGTLNSHSKDKLQNPYHTLNININVNQQV